MPDLSRCVVIVVVLMLLAGGRSALGQEAGEPLAFVGATVWTGTDEAPIEDAVLVVRGGRVADVFARSERPLPDDVAVRDLSGQFVVPGLINAHGHVGMADGLETGPSVHSEANVREQLERYAHYGVTTVVSLGGAPEEAFAVREAQASSDPERARLFLTGPLVRASSEAEAREQVARRAEQDPDWVKIGVDDFLGRADKMPEPVYAAVIEAAHQHDLPLAAHMVYLEDAKRLVRHGADLLAHSVRDVPVDQELIELMRERGACITPTLTRDLSTYVYAERPDFFDDPFFLEHADPEVLERLQQPDVQADYRGEAPDYYREALPLAQRNLRMLHEAGVPVALGTDSGPPARFQGYFEHLEMEMMQEAGLAPVDVLRSATSTAADCMGLDDLGALTAGRRADFVVLGANPLEDVRHLREIEAVYLSGTPMDR